MVDILGILVAADSMTANSSFPVHSFQPQTISVEKKLSRLIVGGWSSVNVYTYQYKDVSFIVGK